MADVEAVCGALLAAAGGGSAGNGSDWDGGRGSPDDAVMVDAVGAVLSIAVETDGGVDPGMIATGTRASARTNSFGVSRRGLSGSIGPAVIAGGEPATAASAS